jgi:ribonuclease HI
LEVRKWRHPAEITIIREVKNGTIYTIKIYAERSKMGDKVGAAGIIILNGKLVHQLKFTLHGHCSNNEAEKIATSSFTKIRRTSACTG